MTYLLLANSIWQRWWDMIPLTRLYVWQMWRGFSDTGTVDFVLITTEIILGGPDIIRWKPLKDGLYYLVRLFLSGFEEVSSCHKRACERPHGKELWFAPKSQGWPMIDSKKPITSILQTLGTEFCQQPHEFGRGPSRSRKEHSLAHTLTVVL